MLIGLALLQGALLLSVPSIPLMAIGLWWNANTVAHNFIHLPFFRSRAANRGFSIFLTVVQGIPQTLWRDRHLAHHAGRPWRLRVSRPLLLEGAVVLGLWVGLLTLAPRFFLWSYVPGYLLGLGLCQLQGYYEHACGTTSHHGALYNWLFFNDGYHVEHHRYPGEHWTRIPQRAAMPTQCSRWPAVLRCLDSGGLDALERVVLRSRRLQRYVLDRHERAFRKLLPRVSTVRRIAIVGGGLFPRTALILQKLLPEARLVVLDANVGHLQTAQAFLGSSVALVHERFDGVRREESDLVTIPLAFVGDRAAIYARPPAAAVLVHDWIWRPRGKSVIISWPLLKRLNLIEA